MKEVMALSHRITVLSRGRVMATLNREDTYPEELADLMIGSLESKGSVKVAEVLKETELDKGKKHHNSTVEKNNKFV